MGAERQAPAASGAEPPPADAAGREEHFRLTFDQAPAGMAIVGDGGRFLRVNRALCEILGYSAEELARRTTIDVTHPDDRGEARALAERLSRGEAARMHAALRWVRKDGRAVETTLDVALVRAADGAPIHAIAKVEDVTARNATQRALLELERRVAHAERLATIGQLAGGMAHEINNPLASVLANVGYALELLARGKSVAPEALREALDDANEGAARVARVVEGLRRFAATEGDDAAPAEIPRAVEAALEMTEHAFAPLVTVERDYQPTPRVRASSGQLTQLFASLLLDVAEAIHRRGARATAVRVATRGDDAGLAVIEVRGGAAGADLELSVCRGIVKGMGGSIATEATARGETVFRVSFPAVIEARA